VRSLLSSKYGSGQFGGRSLGCVDNRVVGVSVVVNRVEVASRQADLVAASQFPLLGDGQWAGDTDELNVQSGQRIHPDRQQIRAQQHLTRPDTTASVSFSWRIFVASLLLFGAVDSMAYNRGAQNAECRHRWRPIVIPVTWNLTLTGIRNAGEHNEHNISYVRKRDCERRHGRDSSLSRSHPDLRIADEEWQCW
jgi:hypothetical protein